MKSMIRVFLLTGSEPGVEAGGKGERLLARGRGEPFEEAPEGLVDVLLPVLDDLFTLVERQLAGAVLEQTDLRLDHAAAFLLYAAQRDDERIHLVGVVGQQRRCSDP